MKRMGMRQPHGVDGVGGAAARDRGRDAMRSKRPGLHPHIPPRALGLLWVAALAIGWAAAPAGAAGLTAMTERCSHVTQHVTLLQTDNCVFDNETGVDTPLGPLANASIRDPFRDPNVNPIHPYDYLGQATAQAGFGHVGTSVEVQVENANPTDMVATPIDVIGTTIRAGGANASRRPSGARGRSPRDETTANRRASCRLAGLGGRSHVQ